MTQTVFGFHSCFFINNISWNRKGFFPSLTLSESCINPYSHGDTRIITFCFVISGFDRKVVESLKVGVFYYWQTYLMLWWNALINLNKRQTSPFEFPRLLAVMQMLIYNDLSSVCGLCWLSTNADYPAPQALFTMGRWMCLSSFCVLVEVTSRTLFEQSF